MEEGVQNTMSADQIIGVVFAAGISYIIVTLPRAVDNTFFGYYFLEAIPVAIAGLVSIILILTDLSKGLDHFERKTLLDFLLLVLIFFSLCFLGFIIKIPSRYIEITYEGWKTEFQKTVPVFLLEDIAYFIFGLGFFYKWWIIIQENKKRHMVFALRCAPFFLMVFFFIHVHYSGYSYRPAANDLPKNLRIR